MQDTIKPFISEEDRVDLLSTLAQRSARRGNPTAGTGKEAKDVKEGDKPKEKEKEKEAKDAKEGDKQKEAKDAKESDGGAQFRGSSDLGFNRDNQARSASGQLGRKAVL